MLLDLREEIVVFTIPLNPPPMIIMVPAG